MSEYRNAMEILPEELIAEIHKHFKGGMLWVPVKGTDRAERDKIILQLAENDVPATEIATLAKLTPRHVRRIVQIHSGCRTGADTN